MSKKEDDKLVNAIIDLHQDLKGELAKMNLAIGEMRLSYMRMDATLAKSTETTNKMLKAHEERIVRLENQTLGNSFVSEPGAKYKKRRKK